MYELNTIELETVTGAGKLTPIIKGAEKAYEVAKPYLQKAWRVAEGAAVATGAVDGVHRAWNWLTGKKD